MKHAELPEIAVTGGLQPDVAQVPQLYLVESQPEVEESIGPGRLVLFGGRLVLEMDMVSSVEQYGHGIGFRGVTGLYQGPLVDRYANDCNNRTLKSIKNPFADGAKGLHDIFVTHASTPLEAVCSNEAWDRRDSDQLLAPHNKLNFHDPEQSYHARELGRAIVSQGKYDVCVVTYDETRPDKTVLTVVEPGVGSGAFDIGQKIR